MKGEWALDRLLQQMVAIIRQREERSISMEEMSVALARPRASFEAELLLLAELGRAHFSPSGHTLHFPPDFERHVAAASPRWPRLWRAAQRYLLAGARLFFGGGLLLSLLLVGLVLLLLLVLMLSASRGRRDRPALPLPSAWGGGGPSPGGGGGGPSPLLTYLLLRDLLMYSASREPLRRGYPEEGSTPGRRGDPDDEPNEDPDEPGHGPEPGPGVRGVGRVGGRGPMPGAESPRGLLRDIFRFLFGDGYRAQDDHHRRSMTAVGHLIRRQPHGPVVSAQQMAPYLDEYLFHHHPPPPSSPSASPCPPPRYTQHEGYVLPVLRCFGGRAEASEDGQHLEYHFPDLASPRMETSIAHTVRAFESSSCTQRRRPGHSPLAPPREAAQGDDAWGGALEEGGETPPILERAPAFFYTRQTLALGVWNLVQVGLLGWALFYADTDLWMRQAQLDPWVAVGVGRVLAASRLLYAYLLVYACFYLLFPAARYLYHLALVRRMAQRNHHRIQVVADLVAREPRGSSPPSPSPSPDGSISI